MACWDGICHACPQGATDCNPASAVECRDLNNDQYNCGACGKVCGNDQYCNLGTCECYPHVPDICNIGGVDTCVNLSQDKSNCGTCGNACLPGAGSGCQNGTCVCNGNS